MTRWGPELCFCGITPGPSTERPQVTEKEGLRAVESAVEEGLVWIFRELALPDYAVDEQVEVVSTDLVPTGRLLGRQVKSSASYFTQAYAEG